MPFNNPDLKSVFEEPPMASLIHYIGRKLCRSRLSKVSRSNQHKRNTHASAPGWKNCSKPCPACPFTLPSCNTVKGQVSEYEHNIQTPVNCQSTNIVYYWKCTKDNCSAFPHCEYRGLSTRSFQKRFYEHQYYIKSDKLSERSGEHFNLPGHSLSDMKGLILEEVLLIEKCNTFGLGLNKEP